MAKNYLQASDIIDYTATKAIKSGSVVIQGSLIGITITDINIGETGAIQRTGVWSLPKKEADAFIQGANIYWDETNQEATATTSNILIGFAVYPSASDDTNVKVALKN